MATPPTPPGIDRTAAERTLRLARHLFGVEVAAWVPLSEEPLAADGPLHEAGPPAEVAAALRAVAARVAEARAGAIVGDAAALPRLAALSGRFRFLAAAPIRLAGSEPAALLLLDRHPRPNRPAERAALADLVLLLDSGAPPPAEGPVLLEYVPSPVGTLTVREEGFVFDDGNAAAARYFGAGDGGLAGRSPEDLALPPEAAARWLEAARASVRSGEPVRFAYEQPGPAGPRCLQVTVRRADAAGEPRVAYVAEDVTERARAEAALQRSHAELERIFASSPDAIVFAGPDRVVRRANPAACRLFGYAEGEIAGRPMAALYADPADHERQGRERFGAEAPLRLEPARLRWRRRDGGTFLGEVVGAPIREPDGTHTGFVGIIRDVSEQVRAAAALRESETLLRALVDSAPVVLFALDAEGRFTLSEGQGLAPLGLRPGEIVGASAFEVYADNPEVVAGLRDALRGEPVSYAASAGERHFENRVAPLRGPNGEVAGAIGVAVDVTERARAEAALRAAHAEAEAARQEAERARAEAEAAREEAERARRHADEAARRTSAFLAAMSHEIRTPLTGVIGFADLLAEEAEGDARAYAELIQRSGRRLMDTLNSVLDLARIEAEEVEARRARVDLAAEAAEAAQLLRPLAQKKGLELAVDAAPLPVLSDPGMLHRVLTNLIGNAIKFTEAGRVAVSVRAEGEVAVVRVEDTGRGIDPDFLPHLFEPFRREEDGAGRPAGTGLGLAITKKLVALLGGRIEVDSAQGRGSTFALFLPLEAVEEAPAWRPVEELTGIEE